jgi:hypothetical protein
MNEDTSDLELRRRIALTAVYRLLLEKAAEKNGHPAVESQNTELLAPTRSKSQEVPS